MKQRTAIKFLRAQIDKIHDNHIKREEWLTSTSSLLIRIFPVTAKEKIGQLEKIQNNPEYFDDISAQERIANRKNKATNFLNNHIEEIILLGMEGNGSKLGLFFGSFRFWGIMTAVCILGFLIGSTSAKTDLQNYGNSNFEEYRHLELQLDLKQRKVDSLKNEIRLLHTMG